MGNGVCGFLGLGGGVPQGLLMCQIRVLGFLTASEQSLFFIKGWAGGTERAIQRDRGLAFARQGGKKARGQMLVVSPKHNCLWDLKKRKEERRLS